MKLSELKILAQEWANTCQSPHTLALYGDMGAGKTTFAQFALEHLIDHTCAVTSPTFPIVQVYSTIKGDVWHADLYRLKSFEEVEETGLIEAMYQNICIIEWPQLIEPILKNIPHRVIHLTRTLDEPC